MFKAICYICNRLIVQRWHLPSVKISYYHSSHMPIWSKHAHQKCFKNISCKLEFILGGGCCYCYQTIVGKKESYRIDFINTYDYHDECFKLMVDEKTYKVINPVIVHK